MLTNTIGGALHSGSRTLWCGENYGFITKVLLLAQTPTSVGKYIRSYTTCAIAKPTIKKQGMYTTLPTPS